MTAVARLLPPASVALVLLFIAAAGAAQPAEKRPNPGASAGAAGPAAATTTSGGPPRLTIKNGRLTASFKDVTLAELADAISHRAPIAVIVSGACAGHRVAADFNDVPVDQAMRQLLRHEDVFYFYGVEGNQPTALKAVWVYPKGHGRGLFPIPPDQWGSTRDLLAGLASKDPNVRAHAIESLVQRKRDGARDELLTALNDSSSEVRAQALYAAMQAGVDIPPSALKGLIQDSSPDVRFLALQVSANGPDARSTAQALLNDPSEAVRSAAQATISRLDEQAAPAAAPATSDPSPPN